MRLYTFPAGRVKRTRACQGCGITLAPWQPADEIEARDAQLKAERAA